MSLKDYNYTNDTEKRKVLLCYRNDNEAAMSEQIKTVIEKELQKRKIEYSYTDMISKNQILADVRENVNYE